MIKKQHLKRKHFTIVELLVAISIIAVLAGMLVGGLGGAQEQGSKAATKADILKLEMALEQYKRDNGAYPWITISDPKTLTQNPTSDANDPSIADILAFESFTVNDSGAAIDAWDNIIYYIPNNSYGSGATPGETIFNGVYYNPKSFQLISAGPDGTIGNDDDIYNFDKKK
jgi:general secretion pathway protein G